MAYECIDVDSLSNVTFHEVCVASNLLQNETSWTLTQSALQTCCGSSNYHTVGDCYIYCNISTPYDTVMMNECLLDTLDQDTSDNLDYDCFPTAWELYSTTDTKAGMIATTWTFPYITWTATETNGVVETITVDHNWSTVTAGAAKTTPSHGSTATATTDTKSTSTTATPTSSKSASKAGRAARISWGIGASVAFSILALVL